MTAQSESVVDWEDAPSELVGVEFVLDRSEIVRNIKTPVGGSIVRLPVYESEVDTSRGLSTVWAKSLLRAKSSPRIVGKAGRIAVADLFCGAGGLALGARWAIEALGYRAKSTLAVDVDSDAVNVNQYNNLVARTYVGSVRDLFSPHAIERSSTPKELPPSASLFDESSWLEGLSADVLVGGPPCQGHSTFNNHTRGRDDRNQLYFWMAAAAHALQAKVVIIENVATVMSDAGDVVGMTHEKLVALGYSIVFSDVLRADRMGVAQTRRRHFTVAIREDVLGPASGAAMDWLAGLSLMEIPILDVISDLADLEQVDAYNAPSELSEANQARIDYLFDNDRYELPDPERPVSHQEGHSYPSVYGRLRPDQPAGTLTTGFLSPGRGRFVHPTRRRTLTLHEGARVQGFPDTFKFVGASGSVPSRTAMARMIGDAVPPPMAFNVVLAALSATKEGAFSDK